MSDLNRTILSDLNQTFNAYLVHQSFLYNLMHETTANFAKNPINGAFWKVCMRLSLIHPFLSISAES